MELTTMQSLWFLVAFALTATNCKESDEGSKIANGETSPIRYPYQISLEAVTADNPLGGQEVVIPGVSFPVPVFWDHFCGGSILNKNYIVTAGHCFLDINTTTIGQSTILSVLAGTNVLGQERQGQRRLLQSCKVHPDFHNFLAINETLPNDVAVCRLQRAFTFQAGKVAPIALSKSYVDGGANCVLTGWGYTKAGGNERKTPKNLMRANVKTITLEKCNERFANVTDNEVCTKLNPFGGACPGDSGGPIQCNNELVGIVSWGVCGSANPDVNTRVSKFADFIEQNSSA